MTQNLVNTAQHAPLIITTDPEHSSTPHPDEIDISLSIAAVVPSETVLFSLGNGSFLIDEVGPLFMQLVCQD